MDLEVEKDEQVTRWWKEKFQFSKNKSIYKWINSKLEEFPNFLSWRKLPNFSPKNQPVKNAKVCEFYLDQKAARFPLGNF